MTLALVTKFWRSKVSTPPPDVHGLWKVTPSWRVCLSTECFKPRLICDSIDGRLFMFTPIDPAFLLLPILEATVPVSIIRSSWWPISDDNRTTAPQPSSGHRTTSSKSPPPNSQLMTRIAPMNLNRRNYEMILQSFQNFNAFRTR